MMGDANSNASGGQASKINILKRLGPQRQEVVEPVSKSIKNNTAGAKENTSLGLICLQLLVFCCCRPPSWAGPSIFPGSPSPNPEMPRTWEELLQTSQV